MPFKGSLAALALCVAALSPSAWAAVGTTPSDPNAFATPVPQNNPNIAQPGDDGVPIPPNQSSGGPSAEGSSLAPDVTPSPGPISKQSTLKEERALPKRPSAPPDIGNKRVAEDFACERLYTYRKKPFRCDSNLYQDGENLRPVIKDVPAAVTRLNEYQVTRRRIRSLAYTGASGIGLIIVSPFFGEGTYLKRYGSRIGLGITGLSVLYGVSILRSNDENLTAAVMAYNEARPDDPIELNFKTESRTYMTVAYIGTAGFLFGALSPAIFPKDSFFQKTGMNIGLGVMAGCLVYALATYGTAGPSPAPEPTPGAPITLLPTGSPEGSTGDYYGVLKDSHFSQAVGIQWSGRFSL